MRRTFVLGLAALAACGGGGTSERPPPKEGRPVGFRVIREGQEAAFCVQGPKVAFAPDAAAWAAAWRESHACQPQTPPTPALGADEVGVVVWWKVEGCLGYGVKTGGVILSGRAITVAAEESKPPAGVACAQALGGLESFLVLDRAAVAEADTIRFVLDGTEVGSVATLRGV